MRSEVLYRSPYLSNLPLSNLPIQSPYLISPIVFIRDQGAGGNGNVLKEIVDPQGARYELRKIPVGDPTLSALEIWGAEYQVGREGVLARWAVALLVA